MTSCLFHVSLHHLKFLAKEVESRALEDCKKEILEEVHDVGESPNGLDGLAELISRSDYFDCKSIQFLVF